MRNLNKAPANNADASFFVSIYIEETDSSLQLNLVKIIVLS